MQNSQKYNMEQLFQDMRPLPAYKEREDATCKEIFDKNVIEGWYRARAFVIHLLKHDENMGASGIKPSSSDHVHIIIHYKGNPLALYIARQVALVAHFPNFKENSVGNKNRTIITLLYNRNRQTDILQELKKQENLCNLPDVCKYVIKDGNTGKIVREDHTSSYIDVELELVAFDNNDFSDYSPNRNNRNKLKSIVIDEEKLQEIGNNPCVQEINVCNARRVNMVYNVGADIDNLPSDDPNTAERYSKALLYFCYQQTPKDTQKKWEELCDENNKDTLSYQIKLRNKLSNVLCADCFTTRLKSVCKNFEELLEKNEKMVLGEVQKNLQVLAQCEHARWNVEKLILGFSPLSLEERWKDAQKFGSARKVFRKKLKDKGHHIDLCSYQDLHRIDPANMKYDCFLNLAMVRILKEANGI